MDDIRILIFAMTAVLIGHSAGEPLEVPASADVYITLGTGDERAFNQTDLLLCSVNVTEENGTRSSTYPGVPLLQFDLSDVNITEDDIAVLVLKAATASDPSGSAMIALLSVGSDWDESSDYTTFLVNLLPAWNVVKKDDLTQMSTDTDGDGILAFDVSKKLRDAKEKGDRASFLLEAISNSSYEVEFFSRESGQGPHLIVMPYPGEAINTTTGQQAVEQPSNETEPGLPSEMNATPADSSAVLLPEAPMVARS
ncbi:MAG: hypothetical protein QUS08_05320 [Methanothrix sp.]|nr:hypothetical protein [Methanothrix sp.]